MPIKWEKAPQYIRDKYLDYFYSYQNESQDPKSSPIHQKLLNIHEAINFILDVKPTNCHK